jgi:hypothetical protein
MPMPKRRPPSMAAPVDSFTVRDPLKPETLVPAFDDPEETATQAPGALPPTGLPGKEFVKKRFHPTRGVVEAIALTMPHTAVDVYVSGAAAKTTAGQVFFRIYAVNGDTLTLVGRGILPGGSSPMPGAVDPDPTGALTWVRHVASARVAAQAFIVKAYAPAAKTTDPELDISIWGYDGAGGSVLAKPLRQMFQLVNPKAFAMWGPASIDSELLSINGLSQSASTRWVQLHDRVGVPVTGDFPVEEIQVFAGSQFSLDYGDYPREFVSGLGVAISTTSGQLTLAPPPDGLWTVNLAVR